MEILNQKTSRISKEEIPFCGWWDINPHIKLILNPEPTLQAQH
jgi:hypothetical protein